MYAQRNVGVSHACPSLGHTSSTLCRSAAIMCGGRCAAKCGARAGAKTSPGASVCRERQAAAPCSPSSQRIRPCAPAVHASANKRPLSPTHPCAIMRLALPHQAGEAAGSRGSTWPGPRYPYMVPGWARRPGAAPGAAHPGVLFGSSPLSRERLSFIDFAPGPSALAAWCPSKFESFALTALFEKKKNWQLLGRPHVHLAPRTLAQPKRKTGPSEF